jgi:hypothetical protein
MQNIWDVSIQRGWIFGLSIVATLLAITVGLTVYAVTSPITMWLFVLSILSILSLSLAIRLVYQIWGLITASYTMDRNAIVIHWGGVEHIVPMAKVRKVMPGNELRELKVRPAIRWPGYYVGLGKTEDIDTILFYATTSPDYQVVIKTDTVAYAISPVDLETFLPALRERLEMGPTQEIEEQSTHPPFLDWDIWRDRLALGLLIGAVFLLTALVGFMCWRFPYLPSEVALRFSADGVPLLIASKNRVFYLSLLGLIFTAINSVLGFLLYHRERTASYFLWSSLCVVLIALWTAVLQLFAYQ